MVEGGGFWESFFGWEIGTTVGHTADKAVCEAVGRDEILKVPWADEFGNFGVIPRMFVAFERPAVIRNTKIVETLDLFAFGIIDFWFIGFFGKGRVVGGKMGENFLELAVVKLLRNSAFGLATLLRKKLTLFGF